VSKANGRESALVLDVIQQTHHGFGVKSDVIRPYPNFIRVQRFKIYLTRRRNDATKTTPSNYQPVPV